VEKWNLLKLIRYLTNMDEPRKICPNCGLDPKKYPPNYHCKSCRELCGCNQCIAIYNEIGYHNEYQKMKEAAETLSPEAEKELKGIVKNINEPKEVEIEETYENGVLVDRKFNGVNLEPKESIQDIRKEFYSKFLPEGETEAEPIADFIDGNLVTASSIADWFLSRTIPLSEVIEWAKDMRKKVDKGEYCKNEGERWANGYDCAMYDLLSLISKQ
jgi:hypothetical protein